MSEMTVAPARSAKEQFDRQAAHYDAQWNAWSEETLGWLLENAEPRPSDFVLDVATGTGFTALALAPRVQTVIGMDVSSGMLEQARRQAGERRIANAVFQEGAAESLLFADESFDIVTCRVAPHHFLDVQEFLAESARVLKSGGCLALVDTTVPDDSPEAAAWQNAVEAVRDPSHVRNHTPDEWRAMTKAAGLTVAECGSGGGGITIPLSSWITKAGCTPDQAAEVRRRFAEAPESARTAFQIVDAPDGETVFTWQRVALKAVKPSTEWRTVFENGSREAALTTVRADLTVSTWLASTIPPDLDILPSSFGLPELPAFAINLHLPRHHAGAAATELAQHIRDGLVRHRHAA